MKLAEIIPVFKKDDKNLKNNCRPTSNLSNLSKVLEKIIHDQISFFSLDIPSKYQCGFRKGSSSQHCFIAIIKKWKKSDRNKGTLGASLKDLSKAFDCIPHELLIAILSAYGFDFKALKFIYSYINNRKQSVESNKTK